MSYHVWFLCPSYKYHKSLKSIRQRYPHHFCSIYTYMLCNAIITSLPFCVNYFIEKFAVFFSEFQFNTLLRLILFLILDNLRLPYTPPSQHTGACSCHALFGLFFHHIENYIAEFQHETFLIPCLPSVSRVFDTLHSNYYLESQ